MTEAVNQRYADLDIWPLTDMVEAMHAGQTDAILALRPALGDIAAAAQAAADRLKDTGRLIYVGAGTSGRLAVLDGSELGPTFGWPQERTVYCMAGGTEALIHSQEGAEDDADAGRCKMIEVSAGATDVIFCVAASGRTPFTLGALLEAKARGAMTIGIANNPDTPILNEAEFPILAETGSEILAGSTRLKAGTAQKIILNMLSTAIMTRLGRVYNGLMVDMIVSNAKLENRAANMVSQIANCSLDAAQAALKNAQNNIKLAALICSGASLTQGEAILKQESGNLRRALAHLPQRSR